MEKAIRYFTKSKKGNTYKLAKAIEEALELEALTVEHPLEKEVDVLFLVNAMYAFDVDKEIKNFLKDNAEKIKCIVNINSSASGASTLKNVKKVANKLGIPVSEKEFHCVGSWINLNKGKPNEQDLENLKKFVLEF